MRATAGRVYARLRDMTDDAEVAGSLIATTAADFTLLQSGKLALLADHEYALETGRDEFSAGEVTGAIIVGIL